MFTTVDLSKGYYNIELDEASLFLTTFNTPFDTVRFTRIPFRLIAAGDAFQCKIDAVFSNLDFCTCIADDMVIWGEQPDGGDHDKHLTESLQVTRKHNLELNIDKLWYKTKHASFFGTTFTLMASNQKMKKIQALNKIPQPPNVKPSSVFWVWSST